MSNEEDMVNRPPHYRGHPTIEAIEIIRHIRDSRLAAAQKYLYRVAFGGKWDNEEDAQKILWYIQDYLNHPIP